MNHFVTLAHVDRDTGTRKAAIVETADVDDLYHLFSRMAVGDIGFGDGGQMWFPLATGTLSVTPFGLFGDDA